jgi:hypothetical protein
MNTNKLVIPALMLTASMLNPQVNDLPDLCSTYSNFDVGFYEATLIEETSMSILNMDEEYDSTNIIVREFAIINEAKELFGNIRSMTVEESNLTRKAIELHSDSLDLVVF